MIKNLKIFIGGRSEVSDWHSENITHLIVIRDSDVKHPYIKHYPRTPVIKEFIFEDIIEDISHYSDPNYYAGPREKHIKEIIDYAEKIKQVISEGKSITLGISCYAGISRSTATAYIILNVLKGSGYEEECFKEVLRIRDCAIPNINMTKMADEILDRGGKMNNIAVEYREKLFLDFKKDPSK